MWKQYIMYDCGLKSSKLCKWSGGVQKASTTWINDAVAKINDVAAPSCQLQTRNGSHAHWSPKASRKYPHTFAEDAFDQEWRHRKDPWWPHRLQACGRVAFQRIEERDSPKVWRVPNFVWAVKWSEIWNNWKIPLCRVKHFNRYFTAIERFVTVDCTRYLTEGAAIKKR